MELVFVGLYEFQTLQPVVELDDWEPGGPARSRVHAAVATVGSSLVAGGSASRQAGVADGLSISVHRGNAFGASAMVAALAVRGAFSKSVAAALLRALVECGVGVSSAALRERVVAVIERYLGDAAAMAPGAGKLSLLQAHLDRIKDVARASAEDLLERGERLDALVARTDALAVRSSTFRRATRSLRDAHHERETGGRCSWPVVLFALALASATAYTMLRAGMLLPSPVS